MKAGVITSLTPDCTWCMYHGHTARPRMPGGRSVNFSALSNIARKANFTVLEDFTSLVNIIELANVTASSKHNFTNKYHFTRCTV